MPYTVISPGSAAAAPSSTLGAPKTSYGKTLLAMDTALDLMVAGRDDVDGTRRRGWINDAYIDVCTSLKVAELFGSYTFNTVVSQPLYLIPDSVEYIRGVSIVDTTLFALYGGRPLHKSSLDEYRKFPDESGLPYSFFRENEVLVLYPKPDGIRTVGVDVKIRPDLMTTDTHSPILPIQFHEVILKCARAKAFDDLQEFDLAALAENSWVSLLRRKEDGMAEEETTRLVQSSVPRSYRQLMRTRPPMRDPDTL